MSPKLFELALITLAVIFTLFFFAFVIPPVIADGDIVGAFAAGFVNPYAAGYSTDVILCWVALLIWVIWDKSVYSINHGWVCLLLGLVPGVVVGLCLYIVIRSRQLDTKVSGR